MCSEKYNFFSPKPKQISKCNRLLTEATSFNVHCSAVHVMQYLVVVGGDFLYCLYTHNLHHAEFSGKNHE